MARRIARLPEELEIPVISEESSREDLLRYIRILEERLEISHVYVHDPEAADDGEDGARSGSGLRLGLRKKVLDQAERVDMLRRGMDGIACRDIERAFEGDGLAERARETRIQKRQLNLARRALRRA
ncbi:hypothetical protein LAZ40_09350 [Cereibacter sphaeroides]|uniref:hypothetical protein n=1 Tax=Cereibacter sphaeroides TaxID=1063 RepID=UPI001F240C56|nr:hypothetical protein [Cereibacter sphaeroides]MCE6959257.1 hypothetical protein [Cereibacter sphaeroides]MCE6971251.1 hypothetical protein [Cereibacter sphaeroides]